jgi:hypothetical protein
MINFILFCLSTMGLASILVESVIFQPFRDWLKNDKNDSKYVKYIKSILSKIFSCFQCMGFWTGVVCGLILISFNPLIILCCGFAGSFLSPLSATIVNYLEAQTLFNIKDNNE